MGFGEDEYEMKHRRKNWRSILMPVMGFLLAACLAGISFVGADPLTKILRENVSGVPTGDGLQFAVGFGIFLILMMIFAMFYAIFAPKPTKMISEKDLDKEKKLIAKEKLEQKRRRRQTNINMAKERKEREQQ